MVVSERRPQQAWRQPCREVAGERHGYQSETIFVGENEHNMRVQEQGVWDPEGVAAEEEALTRQLCSDVSRQALEGESERAREVAAP